VQLEQRLGEDQLVALVQERLPTAHKTGALATKDLERVRELLQIHSTKAIAGTITHRSSDPSLSIGDRLRCRTSQNAGAREFLGRSPHRQPALSALWCRAPERRGASRVR
jgi:hypothetical protein